MLAAVYSAMPLYEDWRKKMNICRILLKYRSSGVFFLTLV